MGIRIKRKKAKLIVILLVCLVIIVCTVMFVKKLLSQPANGTVIKTGPTALTTPQPSKKALDNQYFTATYSGRFGVTDSDPKTSASLQAWTLVAHQESGIGQSSKISITVATLPLGGAKEDSAYKLYSAHPELYILSETTYAGEPAIVAKRIDPTYQYTVLWPHGSYLLTATLSAASRSDLVDEELQSLLASLRWRQ